MEVAREGLRREEAESVVVGRGEEAGTVR